MENATKALLMAAEILVGVLLLSLIAALIFIFADYRAEIQRNENARLVHEFNTQFQNYTGIVLKPQDVLTIYNLVKDYNAKFENEQISLTVHGGKIENNSDFLNKDTQYKIKRMDYNNQGMVSDIVIKEDN